MTKNAVVAGLVLWLVGCDGSNMFVGSNFSTAAVDVAGVYFLENVDGEPLPVILEEVDEGTLEILAGSIELTRDGRFESSARLRVTGRGGQQVETLHGSGTYTFEAGTVFYEDSEGNRGTSQIQGNTLTEVVEGRSFVFRR